MVAGLVARRNGQERDCDRSPVDCPAWSVVRGQCRGGARARASAQRVRRAACARPSWPVRLVCSHRTTRRGRQPQRDRLRLRSAQGGRHRAVDQLPDQVSRRSLVCPGLPGTAAEGSFPAYRRRRSNTQPIPRGPLRISCSPEPQCAFRTFAGSSPTAAARCRS